jgi:hypothetical protein
MQIPHAALREINTSVDERTHQFVKYRRHNYLRIFESVSSCLINKVSHLHMAFDPLLAHAGRGQDLKPKPLRARPGHSQATATLKNSSHCQRPGIKA